MTASRTIGILKTGDVALELASTFGEYPPMFERLLEGGPADWDSAPFKFESWSVVDGVLPDAPTDADGWIVTGSRHGVYDDLPWMEPLKAFLRAAYDAQVPIVGICFGHQILAEALGGRVEKSAKGWGCGAHHYNIRPLPQLRASSVNSQRFEPAKPELRETSIVGSAPNRAPIALNAMHQDQVVEKPPMAETFLTSEFCEYAGFVYPEGRALSIQAHPEFTPAFERALIDMLTPDKIPPDVAEAARRSQESASLNTDTARGWMRSALDGSFWANPDADFDDIDNQDAEGARELP